MLTNHTFALTTPSWNINLLDKSYQMYSGLSTKFDIFLQQIPQALKFEYHYEPYSHLKHILTAEVFKGVSE
mgnify:CR=1|jgi:hypothetical protein